MLQQVRKEITRLLTLGTRRLPSGRSSHQNWTNWEYACKYDKRLQNINSYFMLRSLWYENYGLVNTETLHVGKEDVGEKDLMLFPCPSLFQMNEILASTAAITWSKLKPCEPLQFFPHPGSAEIGSSLWLTQENFLSGTNPTLASYCERNQDTCLS